MKKEFIGYYTPSEKEVTDAWSKGSFAFDTNTLLNLYRYTYSTRKDFLGALKTIKNKLFLPHQAALEFHANRTAVIDGVGSSYASLFTIFEENFQKNLEPQVNQFKKHPSIVVENLNKLHSDFLNKISQELDKQKKNHPDFNTEDVVLDELTDLFENCTGKEFSKEEISKIFIEGKDRYAESIPPGFKDLESKKKKGDRHVYGDLIIWKELINYSKKEKRPLIFVTDDRKEDWWTIEKGKTIRPREELIKEFFDLTGIRILIYNAEMFLQFAKEKKLIPKLNDKTIKEVKEIRLNDENTYFKVKPIVLSDYITLSDQASRISISDYLSQESIDTINSLVRLKSSTENSIGLTQAIDSSNNKLLSGREAEVLVRIAKGNTISEIANELSLSVPTISTYRTRILEKLSVKNNAEIALYAINHGLI